MACAALSNEDESSYMSVLAVRSKGQRGGQGKRGKRTKTHLIPTNTPHGLLFMGQLKFSLDGYQVSVQSRYERKK
jgi:hypothetical protein